jgi:hypothetical protein
MNRPLSALSAFLFLAAQVVGFTNAQAEDKALPETIKIGGEAKRANGLVKELQNGDASCVMVMTDTRGEEFIESADFELCFQEPSLIGHWVALSYRMENVMADSCQGDPECGDTQRIALVVSAKIIEAPVLAAPKIASHCTASETIVFSCVAGSKVISVCAAKGTTANTGYLQYRFGKTGAKPELSLPAAKTLPGKAATGESLPFAGGGGSWLRFRNGANAYVVYTGIGRWGKNGEAAEKEGVVVELHGKQIANVKCSGTLTSELGPFWFEAMGLTIGEEEEFLFP